MVLTDQWALTCSVCMLGNRTINGHELDDNQCAKTIIQQPVERDDINFTLINGGCWRMIIHICDLLLLKKITHSHPFSFLNIL